LEERDGTLVIQLSPDLQDALQAVADTDGRQPEAVVGALIRAYLADREAVDTHDAWFRAEVEASLADHDQTLPHDEVMREARERLAALLSANAR
jgi:predicted transcriptional regulator